MSSVFDCAIPDERAAGLDAAAAALRRGELVVMPTDTVYGVGADAFAPEAVAALLAAKGRGRDMPVPVLISSEQMLAGVTEGLPERARTLVDRFWPGPLSIVVRHPAHLAWDLGETRGTVLVRMPDHPVALELISRFGPLAVSSANRTGHPPAVTAMDARLQLGAVVPVYLDGGPCPGPVPSSIVDLTSEPPRLLREGVLTAQTLREVLPDLEGSPPEATAS